jgi:hypothetical protein
MRLILPTAGGQHKVLKRSIVTWMRVRLGVESAKSPVVRGGPGSVRSGLLRRTPCVINLSEC